MPKVPYTAFFLGPLAVYPSPTGQQDPQTQGLYLGTDLLPGNYADLSDDDAKQWNAQWSPVVPLKAGRYRFVSMATDANTANTGFGVPYGWSAGTFVEAVTIAAAGTGGTTGTYNVSSTALGGTPAVAQVVVSGGGIISATVVSGGGPFNPQIAPTFGLTEVPGLTGANLLAELFTSSSLVTTFDSTAISYTSEGSLVRGIGLCTVTAAQITAGAWVVIQESGIGQLKITTATSTVTGAQAVAANNGVVTTQAPVYSAVEVGFALQKPAASAIIPVKITIPVIED